MKVSWSTLKNFLDTRKVPAQYIDYTDYYHVFGIDNQMRLECMLDKAPSDTTDLTDFETNYKPAANITVSDSDGATLMRPKQAQKGWSYQARGIEFVTSKLNSLVNDKFDGTAWGDAVIKFYDSVGTELTTQSSITTSCVETRVDFTPTYDYEIIGGFINILAQPTTDCRLWIVGAPGIADIAMISGINLRFLSINERLVIDGRTSKRMNYNNPIPGTNTLRLIIKHDAGIQHSLIIAWEHYKP